MSLLSSLDIQSGLLVKSIRIRAGCFRNQVFPRRENSLTLSTLVPILFSVFVPLNALFK